VTEPSVHQINEAMSKDKIAPITRELGEAFLSALQDLVVWHSDLDLKPLLIDFGPPLPAHTRVYLFSLVAGGRTRRTHEFKAVLRVPGQPVGEYGSFDVTDNRFVFVVAYIRDLDVYVLWDASLHSRFKNGGNIQVRDETVFSAAARGIGYQSRRLSGGVQERVIACQSWSLRAALVERVLCTGDQSTEE
jgi:5-methylcytosine-specific restriction enzyme B